jgi:hypothetical protein
MKTKRIIRWGIVTALACGVFGCHFWVQMHPPKRGVQRIQAVNMVRNVTLTLPSGMSTNNLGLLPELKIMSR